MAGLNLSVGGFGGVQSTGAVNYGSAASYGSGVTPVDAAFSGGSTSPVATSSELMHPKSPVGLATWMGVAAITGLVFLRYSLPN